MKTRLCVSTYGKTVKELRDNVSSILSSYEDVLVEARLDYLQPPIDAEPLVGALQDYAERLIITLRPLDQGGFYAGTDEERTQILRRLSQIKPAYMDLELGRNWGGLVEELRGRGVRVIVSWHDFQKTPEYNELVKITLSCLEVGDVAKVVTYANSLDDGLRVLSLYSRFPANRLVAFCMGGLGRVTRLLSAAAGAPVAYVSLPGRATAEGQYTVEDMLSVLGWASG